MAVTLSYRSSRAEIWRWYWVAWRRPRGLWRYHLALFALAAGATLRLLGRTRTLGPGEWAIAAVVGLVAIVWMPLWPEARFKLQERRLVLDQQGLATSIGSRSGETAWRDVASIETDMDTISINLANKSAYIIPSRAFSSSDERSRCLSMIRKWHSDAASG